MTGSDPVAGRPDPSSYRLEVKRTAQKELLSLPAKIAGQVERTLDRLLAALRTGRRPQDMQHLEGRPHAYRIDSGEYRILFDVDESTAVITVFRIRHRATAYRRLRGS